MLFISHVKSKCFVWYVLLNTRGSVWNTPTADFFACGFKLVPQDLWWWWDVVFLERSRVCVLIAGSKVVMLASTVSSRFVKVMADIEGFQFIVS